MPSNRNAGPCPAIVNREATDRDFHKDNYLKLLVIAIMCYCQEKKCYLSKIAEQNESFRSHHGAVVRAGKEELEALAVEMYACGLSTRNASQ